MQFFCVSIHCFNWFFHLVTSKMNLSKNSKSNSCELYFHSFNCSWRRIIEYIQKNYCSSVFLRQLSAVDLLREFLFPKRKRLFWALYLTLKHDWILTGVFFDSGSPKYLILFNSIFKSLFIGFISQKSFLVGCTISFKLL